MKRFIFSFFILINSALLAQDDIDLSIIPGIRFGPNFSTLAVNETPDAKSFRGGFHVAGYVITPLNNDGFSFQPEIMFAQKGFEATYEDSTITFNSNYLELPLLLRYNFALPKFNFYINGGPYIGVWLGGNVTISSDSVDISGKYEFQEGDKRFATGFHAGAGITYSLGPGRLVLEGRYMFGVSNINKELITRNRLVSVSIGYDININVLKGILGKGGGE